MLVFKRAINLLLCALLAYTPTLAWARPHVKSPKPQPKLSHLQAKAKSLPKLASPPLMTGGEALRYFAPEVRTKSGNFHIIQEPGANGRLKSQIVRGDNFEEILVDQYGNGTASFWQVTRGNRKFVATNPFNGRFTKLEVEERRAHAVIKSKFYWNVRTKKYGLAGVNVVPYKNDAYKLSAIATTCELRKTDPTLIKQIDELDAYLKKLSDSTKKSPDAALACKLKRYQDLFVDPSCQNSQFGPSVDAMLEGLAKTMASPMDGSRNSQLKCVEEHGFAINSNEVKSFFLKNVRAAEDALASASAGSYPFYDDQCDRKETISPFGNPIKVSSLIRFPKMITCDARTKEIGHWDERSLQVVVGRTADQIVGKTRLPTSSAVDAYAALFTHELLHQSGLPDPAEEDKVAALEGCCSYPLSHDHVGGECYLVDDMAKLEKAAQAVETVLSGTPAYTTAEQTVFNTFGTNSGSEFMDQWKKGFAKDFETAQAVDGLRSCWAKAGGNVALQEKCATAATNQFTKYTKAFVAKYCPSYANNADVKDSSAKCAAISSQLVTLMQLNSTTTVTPSEISVSLPGGVIKLSAAIVKQVDQAANKIDSVEDIPLSISTTAPLTIAPHTIDTSLFAVSLATSTNDAQIQNAQSTRGTSGYGSGGIPTIPVPAFPAATSVVSNSTPSSQQASSQPRTQAENLTTDDLVYMSITGEKEPPSRSQTQPKIAPSTQSTTRSSAPTSSVATTRSAPQLPQQPASRPNSSTTTVRTNVDSIAVATRAGARLSDAPTAASNTPATETNPNPSATQANTATPGILNLPTNSPLPMPSMSAPTGLLGRKHPDGMQSAAMYADTRIGNALEHGVQAAASIVRDSLIATPANAAVTQAIRLPASDGPGAAVTAQPSAQSGLSHAYAASSSGASSSFRSSSGSSSGASAAPSSIKNRATSDEPAKKGPKEKPAVDSNATSAASTSSVSGTGQVAKAEYVEDADQISEVAKSPMGQRFPNGTTLDREFLMASGRSYDSWNSKLADPKNRQTWSALLAARSRQIVLANGVHLGSPHPVNCWVENATAKRFERVKCGSK